MTINFDRTVAAIRAELNDTNSTDHCVSLAEATVGNINTSTSGEIARLINYIKDAGFIVTGDDTGVFVSKK